MTIIRHTERHTDGDVDEIVPLSVDRATLAKRRWRGTAADGHEFGFDLEHALTDGDVLLQREGKRYVISQAAEPVVEIPLPQEPGRAALMAWQIGNLHLAIELAFDAIRAPDDPAIRQHLDRGRIEYATRHAVFHPHSATTHGGHHHH